MIPASISEYLDSNHARYAVLSHPAAYTAQQEAAAAKVPGREWAKTVVCFGDNQPLLAVVPAPCAVDLGRLQQTAHVDDIRLAREAEFAPLFPECEPGAMPPFGPLFHQRVFVDARLTDDLEVVFSGGSHHDAIRMPFHEFERLAHPVVADFAFSSTPSVAPRVSIDPVCGSAVNERLTAGISDYRGREYYFCSSGCKMDFDDNPEAYARRTR
jgi:Ala-tRNA(Pro) deacylase